MHAHCNRRFLLAIQFDDRTHCKKTLPYVLMLFLNDVPRAGTVQLLQSQPIVTMDPGGMPIMIHTQSLGNGECCVNNSVVGQVQTKS